MINGVNTELHEGKQGCPKADILVSFLEPHTEGLGMRLIYQPSHLPVIQEVADCDIQLYVNCI